MAGERRRAGACDAHAVAPAGPRAASGVDDHDTTRRRPPSWSRHADGDLDDGGRRRGGPPHVEGGRGLPPAGPGTSSDWPGRPRAADIDSAAGRIRSAWVVLRRRAERTPISGCGRRGHAEVPKGRGTAGAYSPGRSPVRARMRQALRQRDAGAVAAVRDGEGPGTRDRGVDVRAPAGGTVRDRGHERTAHLAHRVGHGRGEVRQGGGEESPCGRSRC